MKGEKCNNCLFSLSETNWIVKTLNGQPPLPGRPLTLNFENGRVFGSAGCNNYFGSYTEDANRKLQIGKVGMTRMLCHPNEIMTQEDQFSEMLDKVAGYCLTADSLTLNDAKGGELAVFTPQSQDLAGTSWQAAFVEGRSLVAGSTITAEFEADGKISGSAGCNSYSGGYTASSANKTLDMSPLISTRMMCHQPAGVMEQENNFLRALEAAATYRIEAGWLTIRKADGSSAVRFFKA